MSETPLVSIVLPTYNGRRYLEGSVQSVIDQTYEHWELIIVDDCSTDNTPQLIADLVKRDDRIRCIRHEHNKKLPGALNTGFAAAKGELFSWTSDDNLYRPHALETMVNFLRQHSEVDLVYSDFTLIDDDGEDIRHVQVAPPNMLVRKATVDACFMYRRIVHETLNGYDESLFLIEDYDFWIRASISFTLQSLHEDLYLYRHHEGSLTTQKRRQVMERREAMLIRHLPNLPWATPVDLARGYLHVSELALEHRKVWVALQYALKATRQSPFVVLRHFVKLVLPNALQSRAGSVYRRMRGYNTP